MLRIAGAKYDPPATVTMPVPEKRRVACSLTLEKFACPISLSCDCRSNSISFSGMPMLRLKGFLPLSFSGSMPAGCATSFNSIAGILGLAASITLAHVSQNARIAGVGGLASDGDMVKMECRRLPLRRRWRKVTVMKRPRAASINVRIRVGRPNMIGCLNV